MSAAYRAAPKEVRCTSSRCRSLLPCCSPPWRQGRGRAIQLWLGRSTEAGTTWVTGLGTSRNGILENGRPNYGDGIGTMVSGPSPRAVSNRVFNDVGQNIFSENDVSQWGWAWGQFIDHDIGLRDETPAEKRADAVRRSRSARGLSEDFGVLDFSRTPAAPGTVSRARANRSTRSPASSTPRTSTAALVHGWTGCARGAGDGTRRQQGLAADGETRLPAACGRASRCRRPADGPDGSAHDVAGEGGRGG